MFTAHLQKMQNVDATEFQATCLNGNPTVEDSSKANTFKYNIDIVDEAVAGKHGRRSIEKFSKTVTLYVTLVILRMSLISMISS